MFEPPIHLSRLPATPAFDEENESNRASEHSEQTDGYVTRVQQRPATRADLRPLSETLLVDPKNPDDNKLLDDSSFPLQRERPPDLILSSTSTTTKQATSQKNSQMGTAISNKLFPKLTTDLKSESPKSSSRIQQSRAEREPKVGRLLSEHSVALEAIRSGDVGRPEPLRPVEPQAPAPISVGQRDTNSSVRITIGRVDVRAIMPQRAAPAAPASSRPQPLSLDDYLKQRAGGKR
ncbi:MAG TPA: hypothetical protein VKF81_16630 [Blastocatellia bacterium]|nr:hypothetical protein [Blastocatellia bacterium]